MVYGFNQQFNQQQNPYLGYNQGFGYGQPQQGYPQQGQQMLQNPYQAPQVQYQGAAQAGPNFGINPGVANNGQNFTAVDTQKLKQDAVELSSKAAENVEENSPFSMVKDTMGIDFKNHPKRTIISLALTAATVIGLAVLGNSKFSTKTMVGLGHSVDDVLKNNTVYTGIAKFFTNAKTSVVDFLTKSKTIKNIFETLKTNKAGPKWSFAQGQGQGAKRIFKMTPPDVVKTALDFADDAAKPSVLDTLKKLAGSADADNLYDVIKSGENGDVCKKLTELIAKNFGCMDASGKINKKNLDIILNQLKEGTIKGLDGSLNIDVSELTGVVMDSGFSKAKGPIGKFFNALGASQTAWWPVNLINKAGSNVAGLFGKQWKNIGRGNLGDALIKYNVITGQMADTAVGRMVQKSVVLPTECISNFVNDKSGAGVLISLMALPGMFNNIQEAPKEQKVATAADSLISGIGSFTVTMPLAFGTTYGLASLANMAKRKDGGGFLAGPLRTIGKFFGMGLDPVIKGVATPKALPFKSAILNAPVQLFRKAKGLSGGAMRFVLITLAFSTMFMGPIRKVVNKIFGKPYSIDEEKNKKQQEEAQKALQEQLQAAMVKLQAHPEILQVIESDPQAMAAIQKDPSILIQLAAAIQDTPVQNQQQAQGGFTPSSILQNYVNNPNNVVQPQVQPAQPQQYNPYAPQAPQYQPAQPNIINPAATNPYAPQQQAPIQPQQYAQPQVQAPAQNGIKEPPRSYIPSSKPFNALSGDAQGAQAAQAQGEQITNPNVQAMLSKADKAEQAAMRYL